MYAELSTNNICLLAVNRSAEDARREDQSVIQQTEPRSYGVPEVHGQ